MTAITVIARLTAREGQEDAVRAMSVSLVEPSRSEEGNLSYRTYNDATDARRWVVVEEWESREAFDRHLSSPHMASAFEAGAMLLDSPPVELIVATDDHARVDAPS
ncbi:putative quinol monooxygenase [Microbacterium sp. ASV49]|uniref:Quinol monooxygenase n=1 Tax=Microbacterium candidum TaxID=3041922 RepID=A0ABT7MWN0_9MICO|nr:putative quinol monooxygenase [Microbacterium sp. ASV49]MDL9978866.1 putative quinol monooxygenase [Microbacterium sp. ASV49]